MFRGNNKNTLCKVCNQSVTNQTGTQCKGICHGWVHFDCLNFPLDKINDIRCGAIALVCPCPSCKIPKEYLYQKKPDINLKKPGECKEVAINTRCQPQAQAAKCKEAVQLSNDKCEQATETNQVPRIVIQPLCKEPKFKSIELQIKENVAPQNEKCGNEITPNIDPIGRRRLVIHSQMPHASDKSGVCELCGHKGKIMSKGQGKGVQISSLDIDKCERENKMKANKKGKPIPCDQSSFDRIRGKENSCKLEAKVKSLSDSNCSSMKSTAANTSVPSAYNVEKMCTAVGELTDQIHRLMGKMRETVLKRENIYKKKIEKFERQPLACVCSDDGNDH